MTFSRLITTLSLTCAVLFGASLGPARAEGLIADVKLSELRPMETRGFIDGHHQALTFNDIASGPDGVVWAATEQGVFRSEGIAWEYVPSHTTDSHVYSTGLPYVPFKRALRIAVADDGTPWVVAEIPDLHPDRVGLNRTERGLLYLAEEGWVRATGRIRDVGAGGGRVWALSQIDVQGPGTGWILMRGTADGFDSLYSVPPEFFIPTAVDVSEDGTVFLGTLSGSVYSLRKGWDGAGECNDLDAKCGWTLETPCEEKNGPILCLSTDRSLFDLAVGNGSLIFSGAIGETSTVAHFSYNRFSGEDSFVRLNDSMKAIATDTDGHLLGITKDGTPVSADVSYDYTSAGDVLGVILKQARTRPKVGDLLKFEDGDSSVSLRVPNKPLYREGFNPTFGTSIGFVIHPLEDGRSFNGEEQCVLSYRAGRDETFSICLDGSHKTMTIRIGDAEGVFPVETEGQKYYGGGAKPVPVGKRFLLRAENGQAILSTFDEPTQPNGLPIPDAAKISEVGRFFYAPVPTADRGTARLFIGSRDGRNNRYLGYAGLVRIWNTADLKPGQVFVFHYTAQFGDNYMPGIRNLLLDAPFFKDDRPNQTAFEFRNALPLEGLWSCVTCTGEYDEVEFSVPSARDSVGFTFERMEVLRIKNVHFGEDRYGAPKIEIYRDGEGGIRRTTFEMSDASDYFGWQDPRTGELAGTAYTSVFESEPFWLKVLDEDRFQIIHPFNSELSEVYRRIKPELSIFGKPQRDIGKPSASYRGYNILTMSPYTTNETANGGNARRSDGVPQRREGDGIIFEPVRLDDQGNEIDNDWPRGLLYIQKDTGASSNRIRTVETTRQLQQDLRAGFGLGAEVPEVAKFSASTDLKRSTEEMAQSRSMTAVGDIWWAGYGLVLDPARVSLTENFRVAVSGARDAMGTNREASALRAILNEFGTHYANGVVYGCRARFEKTLRAEELSKAAEFQFDVETENEGMVAPTLKVSLDANFGMGERVEFARLEEQEDTQVYSAGGTVSFDSEEATCGEEVTRTVPIGYDLRPITQVLSPILFDDPSIYNDLRAALELELAAMLRENGTWNRVDDIVYKPEMFLVSIDTIEPQQLGSTNAVAGEIALDGPAGVTPIWSAEASSALTPSSLEGNKITVGRSKVLSVVPTASGTPTVMLTANLNGPQSSAVLQEVRTPIILSFAANVDIYSDTATAMSADCLCMTACPDGFEDDNGKCLKNCPEDKDFEARGETMCYGSYSAQAYPLWDKGECEEDVARNHELSGPCWIDGLAFYLPCKEGYLPVGRSFGTCMPICSEFGLDDYEPIGGIKLGNLTCMRPTAERQTSAASAENTCAPGTTPTEFCPKVDIGYTVQRVTLTP